MIPIAELIWRSFWTASNQTEKRTFKAIVTEKEQSPEFKNLRAVLSFGLMTLGASAPAFIFEYYFFAINVQKTNHIVF